MAQKPHMFDGPLRVCRSNPRYFADASGKAIYLTGAHTWANFQDITPQDAKSSPRPFDYDAYLDFAQGHHLNLIRLWHCEFPAGRKGMVRSTSAPLSLGSVSAQGWRMTASRSST